MSTSPPEVEPVTGKEEVDAAAEGKPSVGRRVGRRAMDVFIVIFLLVGLGGAGYFGWDWWQHHGPAPKAAAGDNGVAFGPSRADKRVDLYLDPMCPSCQGTEKTHGAAIDQLIEDKAQVRYHVLGYLDGDRSLRAANAAYCAADQGRFRPYLAVMLQHLADYPGRDTYGDLAKLGKQAGITSGSFASCVKDGKYEPYTRRVTDEARDRNLDGVPAILVNGKRDALLATEGQCEAGTDCPGGN